MRVLENKFFLLFVLIVTSLFLVSVNFSYGHFGDADVWEILQSARYFPTQGYHPSRSWGFPMYEFILYPTFNAFGFVGAQIESAVFYILSGVVFFGLLLYLTHDNLTSFIGALCFLFHPIAVITSSSIVATSQEICLALLALYFFFHYFYEEKIIFLLLTALFCGFATATRQDYLMLFVSLAVTLLFFKRRFAPLFLFILCYLAFAVGPYLFFYGFDYFQTLSTQFMGNDRPLQKILRAVLGYIDIFGLPVLLLTFLFLILKRPRLKKSAPAFLFFAALVFYFIRFAMLPDKLEYAWVLFPLFLLLIFTTVTRKSLLLLFLVAIALPDIFQIHFFRRENRILQIHPGFSAGAIVQDRTERLRNEYYYLGDYRGVLDRVAQKFGCPKYLWYLSTPPGPDTCLIVPEEMLRYWNPDRPAQAGGLEAWQGRPIILFDYPDNRGWRQFIQFQPWKKPEIADFYLLSGH